MKVCILAAGQGTRMGESLSLIHKALLPLENKAILSHIINQFPLDTSFVIAVGYKQKQIQDYLAIAHADLNVEIVTVENYAGEGSGPGLSLYCCKDNLQETFIFTACDTLITTEMPNTQGNWVGVSKVEDIEKWCSIKEVKGQVEDIFYKQKVETDLAFVGIAQISDYLEFWEGFANNKLLEAGELQVNNGIKAIIEKGVKVIPISWEDAGNEENYKKLLFKYEKNFTFNGKSTDVTYCINNRIIKFFKDESVSERRYNRAFDYKGVFVNVLERKGSFYSYAYAKGILLSQIINYTECYQFLTWANQVLWGKSETSINEVKTLSKAFYYEKTLKRLRMFSERYPSDKENQDVVINNLKCLPVEKLLDQLTESFYESAQLSRYHGDLHTDNILYNEGQYVLIDWRDSFGDSYALGDVYYDLAKFLHTLELSVEVMEKGAYCIEGRGTSLSINHECDYKAVDAIKAFWDFIKANQFDSKVVQIINALIYINMSPLYEKEMAEYLYCLGRYSLQLALFD